MSQLEARQAITPRPVNIRNVLNPLGSLERTLFTVGADIAAEPLFPTPILTTPPISNPQPSNPKKNALPADTPEVLGKTEAMKKPRKSVEEPMAITKTLPSRTIKFLHNPI